MKLQSKKSEFIGVTNMNSPVFGLLTFAALLLLVFLCQNTFAETSDSNRLPLRPRNSSEILLSNKVDGKVCSKDLENCIVYILRGKEIAPITQNIFEYSVGKIDPKKEYLIFMSKFKLDVPTSFFSQPEYKNPETQKLWFPNIHFSNCNQNKCDASQSLYGGFLNPRYSAFYQLEQLTPMIFSLQQKGLNWNMIFDRTLSITDFYPAEQNTTDVESMQILEMSLIGSNVPTSVIVSQVVEQILQFKSSISENK